MLGALAGKRILVTRTREQSSALAAGLRELGAEVIEVPTIRIEPPLSYAPLDAALGRLAEYDTLLVTSANTARVLLARKLEPWPVQLFTVAVGPATASALREGGLRVDLQPEPAVAESVMRELAPLARGRRMLLPQAAVARELLPRALRNAGAVVDVVEAYRTVLAEDSRAELVAALERGVDAVTFTSSSTVENFFALAGAAREIRACSIGPITSRTLREHGAEPAIEAQEHDVKGLINALCGLMGDRLTTVYVKLLEEGTDVFRPTKAAPRTDGSFRLLPLPEFYDGDEVWELPPGSIISIADIRRGDKSFPSAVAVAL